MKALTRLFFGVGALFLSSLAAQADPCVNLVKSAERQIDGVIYVRALLTEIRNSGLVTYADYRLARVYAPGGELYEYWSPTSDPRVSKQYFSDRQTPTGAPFGGSDKSLMKLIANRDKVHVKVSSLSWQHNITIGDVRCELGFMTGSTGNNDVRYTIVLLPGEKP